MNAQCLHSTPTGNSKNHSQLHNNAPLIAQHDAKMQAPIVDCMIIKKTWHNESYSDLISKVSLTRDISRSPEIYVKNENDFLKVEKNAHPYGSSHFSGLIGLTFSCLCAASSSIYFQFHFFLSLFIFGLKRKTTTTTVLWGDEEIQSGG